MNDEWGWVYASVVGTGEMLFQVPAAVREELLAGKFPESFPFRNTTTIKLRAETPEETAARRKRRGAGPDGPDIVIETFPWLMAQEGAVEPKGQMRGGAVSWVVPPTEDIARAASMTWGESKVYVAKRPELVSLDGGKLGRP